MPDDRQQWENEYELWATQEEEKDRLEAEKLDALNRLLMAASMGTVYDTREDKDGSQ